MFIGPQWSVKIKYQHRRGQKKEKARNCERIREKERKRKRRERKGAVGVDGIDILYLHRISMSQG